MYEVVTSTRDFDCISSHNLGRWLVGTHVRTPPWQLSLTTANLDSFDLVHTNPWNECSLSRIYGSKKNGAKKLKQTRNMLAFGEFPIQMTTHRSNSARTEQVRTYRSVDTRLLVLTFQLHPSLPWRPILSPPYWHQWVPTSCLLELR